MEIAEKLTNLKEGKKEVFRVSERDQKEIAKKVSAIIAAGIVVSTGGFITLGETGNLPEKIQEWYDNSSETIRKVFGIEVEFPKGGVEFGGGRSGGAGASGKF